MKEIHLDLTYMADEPYDNELFEGLKKVEQTINEIDDLQLSHYCIHEIEDDDNE